MTLSSGTRIGPYTVVAKLGEGGMGEVFRARDTKLDRDVALKILPNSVSSDPDRLMRFEREAKTLAALNHPNIAAIYGVEDSPPSGAGAEGRPTHALVMELVEGDDLSNRISPGAMPVDEVLPIARQIVEALEAAHEAGIVHRDLKPANIKVRADGTVKVLDFGLAKAMDPTVTDSGSRSNVANSPTMTSPALTQMGVILGTAAYMSPEQAKGRSVDKRADIWAFGAVVYEMLTGRRAFAGEDVSDLLVAVLSKDADLSAVPAGTPRPLVTLIRRCLERDPRKRLRDIGDARHLLDEAAAPAEDPPAVGAPAPADTRSRLPLLAAAIVATVSTAVAAWLLVSARTPATPLHLSLALPDGHALLSGPAISRDGQQVAFVSSDGASRPQLYVRRLDEPESRLIAGTEDAVNPFFSPDGRQVAFYGLDALLKVNLAGGVPIFLAASNSNNGGTWLDDGRIVFKRAWNGGLFVVPENGGEATVLIEPNQPNEYAYVWPLAIPGSRSLVFASWGDAFRLRRLDLDTLSQSVMVDGWRKSALAGDLVVFGDNSGELRAVPLDASIDTAVPVTVAEGVDVGSNNGNARFDISDTGTLAYSGADRSQRVLAVVDLAGRTTLTMGEESNYSRLSLSPGERRVAVRNEGTVDILDVERGVLTPLTPEIRSGSQDSPLWLDANRIVFSSNHQGNWDIYSRHASGAGDIERVLGRPLDQQPLSIARDGALLFLESTVDSGNDLWILPRGGTAEPWLATSAEEDDGQFSPDGSLVAYTSNTTGRTQVYVQPRAQDGSRVQVSIDGGTLPAWSPGGDRLYFRHNNAMMAATISTRGGLSAGTPALLFDGGWAFSGDTAFVVMPDGASFLIILKKPAAIPTRIDLILNWFTELARRYDAR